MMAIASAEDEVRDDALAFMTLERVTRREACVGLAKDEQSAESCSRTILR